MESPGNLLQPGTQIRPIVTFEDVRILAEKYFGLKVTKIKELNGYDDKNYQIFVDNKDWDNLNIDEVCESGYILKIVNTLDSKDDQFFEGQNALLLFLAQKKILCPKPIQSRSGKLHEKVSLTSGLHILRILEYIDGTIMCQVPTEPHLLYQIGEWVARIDVALKNFHHPAYTTHKTVWMFEALPELKKFYFAVKNEGKMKLVKTIVAEFTKRVLSITEKLEKGIIHGDINEQNLLVSKENDKTWNLKAVIDFGDSNYACHLYDLAITMTYMIVQSKDIDAGGYVLAGYNSVRPVPDLEINLLKISVAARLCQSLVMGAYSGLQDPNNTYVLRTQEHGWPLLETIWAESDERVLERWLNVAENYKYQL